MNLLIALVIGLMAGAHSATWGMYKDAIYEGFTYRKYFRSIILSGLIAIVFERVTNLEVAKPANMIILYGMTYVIERREYSNSTKLSCGKKTNPSILSQCSFT